MLLYYYIVTMQGRNFSPEDPAMLGGGRAKGKGGHLPRREEDIVALGPTIADHLILILHYFIPGSKLTFSTNRFHDSLLAPTWTAFSDCTGPDVLCSTVFHF